VIKSVIQKVRRRAAEHASTPARAG